MDEKKKAVLKKACVIVGILIVVCMLVFLYRKMQGSVTGDEILRINDQPVYSEEIDFVVENVKLKQREEIVKKAGIDINEFSWDIEVEGKTGYEYAAEAAIPQLAAIKVMQVEAMEQGLIDDIAYPALMRKMEQENAFREEKKRKGGTVFGLTEFNASQYYDYLNKNLSLGNKRELINAGVLTASVEEAKAVYDQNLEYFDNQEYENVQDSAKNYVLEEKYNAHIDAMARKAEIDIPDETRWLESVKKAIKG